MICEYEDKVFSIDKEDFNAAAISIFQFQYAHNVLYRSFVNALRVEPTSISHYSEVPFLPIQFFKSFEVKTTDFQPELIFESSGTTGSVNSRHLVKSTGLYKQSFINTFTRFYGDPSSWSIIGLLPSYLERSNSSLVSMVNGLINQGAHPQSGFYLSDYGKLGNTLKDLERSQQKTLLIGVTFALLDFAAKNPLPLSSTIVMETGGMKGRRRELTREEVHHELMKAFSLAEVHAEYGMTELLSQAYSSGGGRFRCPPWMKILIREEDNPMKVYCETRTNQTGLINVIDLANIYSCSFIATDDVGRLYRDESFEILGRMDNSDLRGCSLMVADH